MRKRMTESQIGDKERMRSNARHDPVTSHIKFSERVSLIPLE
jgi:hypothetical protein